MYRITIRRAYELYCNGHVSNELYCNGIGRYFWVRLRQYNIIHDALPTSAITHLLDQRYMSPQTHMYVIGRVSNRYVCFIISHMNQHELLFCNHFYFDAPTNNYISIPAVAINK